MKGLPLLLALFALAGCGKKPEVSAGTGKLTLFGTYNVVNSELPNSKVTWELKPTGEYSKSFLSKQGVIYMLESGEFSLANNWFTYRPTRHVIYRRGAVYRTYDLKDGAYTVLVKQEGNKLILDPENSSMMGTDTLTPTN